MLLFFGIKTHSICRFCQVQRKLHFSKFWELYKSQHSSGLCELGSPLPKESFPFSLAEGTKGYLWFPLDCLRAPNWLNVLESKLTANLFFSSFPSSPKLLEVTGFLPLTTLSPFWLCSLLLTLIVFLARFFSLHISLSQLCSASASLLVRSSLLPWSVYFLSLF